jgi:4-aminobutyrate aminotransferase-like enzyme
LYSHTSGVKLAIGQNDILFDENGKKYIDFTSGIFCANIGHSNPYVSEVFEKYSKPGAIQHCYTFGHDSRDQYLEQLKEFTGYPYAYLFSSGTEATEAAWKVMQIITGKPAILGMGPENHAFHGKTHGARIMAGKEPSHLINQPPEKTCGIIMEPYDPLFARLHSAKIISTIEQMIKDFGFLLCLDEIQAGFGRTGRLFGYEHLGLTPDFVCIGKGMGNGYPISGLLSKTPLDDFDLSSTHGGDPLACEMGSVVIDYFIDYDVINKAYEKGKILKDQLDELPIQTNCIGLVAALVFTSEKQATKAVEEAAAHGLLLVHTGHSTVKIGPPLTITVENLLTGCEILGETIKEVLKNGTYNS